MKREPYRIALALSPMLACALLLPTLGGATQAHAASTVPSTQVSDGTWVHFPPVILPDGEESGGFVYDAPRARLLVFGGRTPLGPSNKVWALSLGGFPQWTLITPLGSPPSPRYAHSMVYDSARDRLLVYGGTNDGTTSLADLWELTLGGTPAWNQLSPASPPPGLIAHVAVYDPVGDRMIVSTGYNAGFHNDTWQLTLAGTPTWTQLTPSGTLPLTRDFSSAVYDPVGQRMVMFGGNASADGLTSPHPVSDTWALSLTGSPAWTQLPTGFGPSARLAHESFYDPVRHRMVIMGGTDGTTWLNDVAALALDAAPVWFPITPAGPPPGPRSGEAFVYDPTADRAIVFAGKSFTGIYADAFTLNLSGSPQWTLIPTAPQARLAHRPIYDPLRNRLVQFAGITGPSPLTFVNDTWALPLDGGNHWTPLDTPGATRPAPRASHVDVYDAAHDRMILFGGNSDFVIYNDVWTYDLATQAWTPVAPLGAPPTRRESMSGVYDAARSRLIVFGGWDGTFPLNEAWELDFLPTPTWKPFVVTGTPPAARFGHTMVYDALRDRLVVYGGFDNSALYGDVWTVNLGGTPAWTQLFPDGTPPPGRFGHNAMYDAVRDRMVVFGGFASVGGFVNAVYALNLGGGTPVWSPLTPAGTPPSGRDFAGSIYDAAHDRFVITEGNGDIFPPAGDTWALSWGDIPTPTLLTFADEETGPGTARLTWFTPDGSGQRATAYRSSDGASWDAVAELTSDAAGEFVLEDRVAAGGRFDYRLGVAALGGEQFTDGQWVVIPVGVAFGFTNVGPNPSRGALTVAFALAAPGAASLDLYDVAGRRVVHKDLAALGAGAHTVELANDWRLASGVYVLRLAQGRRAVERKVAVVR